MQSFAIISGFIKWVIQKTCEASVLPTRFPKLKVVKLQNNSIPSPHNNCPLPSDSPLQFSLCPLLPLSPFPHKKNHPPPPPPAPTKPTAPSPPPPNIWLFASLTPPPPPTFALLSPQSPTPIICPFILYQPPKKYPTIPHLHQKQPTTRPPSPKQKFLTNLRESCKQKK